MRKPYFDSILLIERLHRYFLEVVKVQLDRMGVQDVNNVQALILYNIAEDELTVGELTARGYYLGSNVSYNVKKLVENKYLEQERSTHDRRSIRVKLSQKGLDLVARIGKLFDKQSADLDRAGVKEQDLAKINEVLQRVERYWQMSMDYSSMAAIAI